MTNTDLNLPDWGPYGKEYVGLSHVADREAGHRWDCFLMPGYHRRAVVGPYALRENRWHWWKATPDLSSYTLRYELEWKDRVYVDLTVEGTGDARRLTAECVNHTDLPVNLDLHLAATLTLNPLRPGSVVVPEDGVWVHALDYADLRIEEAAHRLEHVADALIPGEVKHSGAVDGRAFGGNLLNAPGDRVAYDLKVPEDLEDAVLRVRFHRWEETPCEFRVTGPGLDAVWRPEKNPAPMGAVDFPLGGLRKGVHRVEFVTETAGKLVMDGLVILPRSKIGEFRVEEPGNPPPEWTWDEAARAVTLSYEGFSSAYALRAPEGAAVRCRGVTGDDVPAIVCERANSPEHPMWHGPGTRHTRILTLGPVPLAPGESRTLSFTAGLEGAAPGEAGRFAGNFDPSLPYAFGMERLAATTLTNVVFPVARRDAYVKHYCPGRWWDCLYTWDSGMIGLGLAALDVERAKESLSQYLMPPDDPYAAFVHHGTPLPILAEQAMEIWKRTGDHDWLAGVMPGLRNYYEWLAGRSRHSTTDKFDTGLLQTWDSFYNSGGWDDYPPQHALNADHARRSRITPCVTTAYAIRFARHLFRWSEALGEETSEFRKDIDRWMAALETAWDPEAGHYSYLEHDAEGNPVGIYRHKSGENFNRGFDGIIPLVAGGLPEQRTRRLIELFFDPEELWTPWGGTTVSKRAAYYSDAGYWNGAVWMPHNVMIWRALRELGETEKARQLAEALLACWERECRASYHSFELFRADTGRGAGWHQFSGLSSPLLMLFAEEFTPSMVRKAD